MKPAAERRPINQKESVADSTYHVLYQKIVTGEWSVGDKIPNEFELCDTFGVSRVSIRSAIQKMAALGMLDIRRGDGTYVKAFSLQDYLKQAVPFIIQSEDYSEIIQFREALESAAVKLIIKRYDTAEIAELEPLFRISNEAFSRHDISDYVEKDLQFHRHLCAISHNRIFLIMWDTFVQPLSETIRANATAIFESNSSVDDHHLFMIRAIQQKDEITALRHLHVILNGILP